jgi:hypothetical protein
VSVQSRPTPRLIAATLHEELTSRETRLDPFAIIRRLVDELSRAPAIVVVDESQLLTWGREERLDRDVRVDVVEQLQFTRPPILRSSSSRRAADRAVSKPRVGSIDGYVDLCIAESWLR